MTQKIMTMLATALIATALSVPAHAQMITQQQIDKKREKDKAKLLKLMPTDFQKSVELKDDDLETIATFSTLKGFRSAGGLFDIQGSDVMLRAHVSKRTGAATYQVYAYIWYKETQERRYQSVNYQDGGEIGSATVNNLASRVISCDQYSATLGCSRSEEFVFPISEELLESIAARPRFSPPRSEQQCSAPQANRVIYCAIGCFQTASGARISS